MLCVAVMKKPANKKLTVATETIRTLSTTTLQTVGGGLTAYGTVNATNCNCYWNAPPPTGTVSITNGGCVNPTTISIIVNPVP